MKKTALPAIAMLTLAVAGAACAGGVMTSSACALTEAPVAVAEADDNDATQSGVDNFLPDDDVFGQNAGGIDEGFGRGEGKRPRPEPRDKNGRRPRPADMGADGEGSPNGDIYFVIYGHMPLPPAPQPPVPEDNGNASNGGNFGGEIPEAELG